MYLKTEEPTKKTKLVICGSLNERRKKILSYEYNKNTILQQQQKICIYNLN